MAKLANAAIDDVRRRVQNETLGHRGRAGDPLYGIRKLLLMAAHRLDERGAARIDTALATGDPYDEVGCAWTAPARRGLQRPRHLRRPDRARAVLRLGRRCRGARGHPPDRHRGPLATELPAYFRTGRASSGPGEAINGEIEAIDRVARGFPIFDHYRTRMLLKTAANWHTPPTLRLRGPRAQSTPDAPRSSRRAE